MTRVRLVLLAGASAVVAAAFVALWPLHAAGVSGNALAPRYHAFAWETFAPLPAHPTFAELRRAGVRIPQDVVANRRRAAAVVLVAGLAVTLALGAAGGVAVGRRA